MNIRNSVPITPELVAAHGLKPDEYQRVLDLIGRFPTDLDALGALDALGPTRGDGHAMSSDDIRLFETGL